MCLQTEIIQHITHIRIESNREREREKKEKKSNIHLYLIPFEELAKGNSWREAHRRSKKKAYNDVGCTYQGKCVNENTHVCDIQL